MPPEDGQPSTVAPIVFAARPGGDPDVAEVDRVMQICNACRYCEGFCAVFPAMTRRLAFPVADIQYLANLCHGCGACYHACQYAPPHEFAVNVPRALAVVRASTYAEYAWPAAFAGLYRRNGVAVALALTVALALFLVLGFEQAGMLIRPSLSANFYAVFPHGTLVALFGAVFMFAILALGVGVARFWRRITADGAGATSSDGATGEATLDVLRLKYLDGGHGEGCNEADDAFTLARRRYHHLTFYGFLLCFAATVVATFYHYALGLHAPYAYASLPVALGTIGGLGLVVGPAGLLWLNVQREPRVGDPAQRPMDRGFSMLLLLTSITGLVLLGWRETAAMPLLLAVHLGAVMALFLTLPYGKFVHGLYRAAALLKWAREKREPSRLRLGSE